jgi:hypothetical protein
LGARRAKREAKDRSDEQCRDRLRAARGEAEKLAQALHEIRMARFRDNEQTMQMVDDVLERWSHLE